MKLITAVIREDKLHEVTQAVVEAGARGMTVTAVRGFGQQYGQGAHGYSSGSAVLLHKLRVDVVVQDERATAVTDAVAAAAKSGDIGDGKIWVGPVDSAIRVRTGERDRYAV